MQKLNQKKYVVCPYCNKNFKSLMSHLLRIHGVTTEQFKSEYPLLSLVSAESREKCSKTCKDSGVGKWKKGIALSEEHKEKISLSMKGEKNHFWGKQHTEETKLKMCKNHADFSGEKNPYFKWAKDNRTKASQLAKDRWVEIKKDALKYKNICEASSKRVAKLHAEGRLESYGRGHRQGWFYSFKQKKQIFFRSSYEEKFLMICEKNKEVLQFSNCKHIIPYIDERGNHRNYVPDFLVNEKEIVEIKPKSLVLTERNILKGNAGREYCKKNNMSYKILTESDLKI